MPPEIINFCCTYHLAIGTTTGIATSDPIEKPNYTTVHIKDRARIEQIFSSYSVAKIIFSFDFSVFALGFR